MRIVVEGYPYPAGELRKVVPPELTGLSDSSGMLRLPYVGYCFNPSINDCVFFLPKVVLTRACNEGAGSASRGLLLGTYEPVDMLVDSSRLLDKSDNEFLTELSVWIYRVIDTFYRHNPNSSIVSVSRLAHPSESGRRAPSSLIDAVLALVRFNRDNRDFVMYVIKNINRGYSRVNWRKTVATRNPLLQNKKPVYIDPINKKKQIDFDEELLVIYYSILDYISRKFGIRTGIDCNFDIIKGAAFDRYLDGYGRRRLSAIKYKYFSDKALRLWTLCDAFFARTEAVRSSRQAREYLMATTFDRVFEAVVDELIGSDVAPGFKDQKDGKMIDHIYQYASLIDPSRPIYYIGDSKYYRVGASVKGEAVYKQFTYAKNVIQRTFDLYNELGGDNVRSRAMGYLPYRDGLTEGYNVTPNFFISAKIEKDDVSGRYSFGSSGLRPRIDTPKPLRQFDNRLFDRDTLILAHYDVNFLYLMALYGRDNAAERGVFRDKMRRDFRRHSIDMLNSLYDFYTVSPPEGVERFVGDNFRRLSGKLYHHDGILIMALCKDDAASQDIAREYGAYLSPYCLY